MTVGKHNRPLSRRLFEGVAMAACCLLGVFAAAMFGTVVVVGLLFVGMVLF